MRNTVRLLALSLALLPTLAGAQVYLPPGVGLPPQSVIGNALPQTGDAVAVSFATLRSNLNIPALKTCSSSQWFHSLTAGGVLGCSQPSISDISGLGALVPTFLATPTSGNLRAILSDETGTGGAVFAIGPALVNANLGTPSAAILTNATGLPISTGVSGLGTGVAAGAAINLGSPGAFYVVGGALGTPSSGVATNLTGTAAGLTAGTVTTNANLTGAVTSVGNAASLGSFTSANLRTALTDESGTGVAYFQGGALGTPASGDLANTSNLPVSGLSGAGAGTVTFMTTPSSANLRAMLTDESGTGVAYFQGGDIGTPSAGVATNITGLNATQLTTGTMPAARLGLGQLTNSLGANVALNNTGLFFDGPSVAQGSTGTWWASGTVTATDTAGAANIVCKLWDGTTTIASGQASVSAINLSVSFGLSGFLATPAGNIRISCKDPASTSGFMIFNSSGLSKDSTVSAFRIN